MPARARRAAPRRASLPHWIRGEKKKIMVAHQRVGVSNRFLRCVFEGLQLNLSN